MRNISRGLKITILVVLFIGIRQNSLAQTKEQIDAWIEYAKSAPDDTLKLMYLDSISSNASDGVWQKYNEKMNVLALKLLESPNPAIKLAAKRYLGIFYNNVGFDFGEHADHKSALLYYSKCLKIQEEIGDKKGIGMAMGNIGAIYDRDGETTNAMVNYIRAIKLEDEVKDYDDLISTLTNVGKIYFKKGKYDSALIYFEQGLKAAEHINKKDQSVTTLLGNMGSTMEKTKNYNKALEYYKRGLVIAEEGGFKIGKSINLFGIAEVYYDKGDVVNALHHAQQAITLAIKADNPKNILPAANLLTKIFKKQGKYKDALEMYELEVKSRDSLVSEGNHKAIVLNKFQYEFDKKQDSTKAEQAKIDAVNATKLENQKRIIYLALMGFVVVAFFLILVYKQRNKIAKEKHRSEELLLNILPEDVAQELKDTGAAKVKSYESVTVLFTDFKGFTQISEKMTAEELVAEIDHCFRGFDHIINKYGIEKIKTIGDSYMCAGGVPKTNTTHPEDVVNAALEFRDFILNHKLEREARGEIPFEVRIGVNTGHVVAGIVGFKKFAYDIWGDAVNFASRMESSGEAGKVNISGATYELVKDKFACQHRGKVMAKGKGEVEMYFVEKLPA